MNARSVADALDRLAPPQRFGHDWNDVLERAGVEAAESGRPRWRKRTWLLAAAIIAAVLIPVAAATVAATQNWWFFGGPGPQPLTEPIVVKTGSWDGKRWQLVAYRASDTRGNNDIVCFTVMPYASAPSESTGAALACGGFLALPPSPGAPFGINYGSAQSAELPHWGAGPVVDTATEVAIYFGNGEVLRVPTFAAPESLGHVRFYATAIPEGIQSAGQSPVKVVGLDSTNGVVACAVLDYESASC